VNGSEGLEENQESTGALLKQLTAQTSDLVRYEVDLAKAELASARDEMVQKGKQTGKGAGMFGGAGVLALFGLAAFTVAVILGLGTLIPEWVAALAVALAYAGVAASLASRGRQEIKEAAPLVPEETIESVQEDMQWA
jgi:hypothetical protein